MKAIGYIDSLPISEKNSLCDIELAKPVATARDVLVRVDTISVNPVDSKIRLNKPSTNGEYKIIGWDAVGEVVATGGEVSQFKNGDMVYYAGSLNRSGSNAEFQLVDERLVGHKPKSLSNAEAAALPLTAITAWELLFEHLSLKQHAPETSEKSNDVLLIVGAAGGVGSILIQLAAALTGATIIATASRDSSETWVKSLGADYVINHQQAFLPQLEALDIPQVTHIASLRGTESYFDSYPEILATFGKICMIDDAIKPLNVMPLKFKSQSLHIEFMFARSLYNAADMDEQSKLLNQVSELVDKGYIKTTFAKNLGKINADNLKIAHAEIESGKAIGKIVLEGF